MSYTLFAFCRLMFSMCLLCPFCQFTMLFFEKLGSDFKILTRLLYICNDSKNVLCIKFAIHK